MVVSGLARGIDGAGHQGAVDAGGVTVAVLGCGADRIYPTEHTELYRRIRATGAIVSEYAPGTAPSPENLRRRNRLIVGLSRFVLVAECPHDSGAMIAARAALQQHRPIFVLPLREAGHDRQRSGTTLLAQLGLAAPWNEADLQWLAAYQTTYQRPPAAESKLDDALGKKPESSKANQPASKPARADAATARTAAKQRQSARPAIAPADRQSPSPPAPRSPEAHQQGLPGLRGAEDSQASLAPEEAADTQGSQTTSATEPSAPAADSPAASSAPRRFAPGQRVRHPAFGVGTIKAVGSAPDGILEIKFEKGGLKKITGSFADRLEVLEE